jgi:hypothetical protein
MVCAELALLNPEIKDLRPRRLVLISNKNKRTIAAALNAATRDEMEQPRRAEEFEMR